MGIHSHTHFITPLQGLIHSQANAKKSIYYLPLHNSPGRFILMPPACISFPFFVVVASFNPPAAPFLFVIFKEGAPLRNASFSLCIFESLCKTKRKKQSRSGPAKECLNTCSPPYTHNLSVPRQRLITLQSITTAEEFTQPTPSDSCGGIQRNPISAVSQNSNKQL